MGQGSEARNVHQDLDRMRYEEDEERQEQEQEEEELIRMLNSEWNPTKHVPQDIEPAVSPNTRQPTDLNSPATFAPGPLWEESTRTRTTQGRRRINRELQLIDETIRALDAYDCHAEEGLAYYRRARERMIGSSVMKHTGGEGRAVASMAGTTLTAKANDIVSPGMASGGERRGSGGGSGYDTSRDPRLRR